MFSSKLKKLEKEYIKYCNSQDYDNINIIDNEINIELENIIKQIKKNKNKYNILKFKYLIKHHNIIYKKFDLKFLVKEYGDFKLNKINEIKTKEHILYYDEELSILELKNLNNQNIDKLLKKHINKNVVKIIKNNKIIYYILTNKLTLLTISNYLKIYINKLLYLKNNELNILIGFNAFKPKIYCIKYKDQGLILDYANFDKIRNLNLALESLSTSLLEIDKEFLIKFQKEVSLKLNLYIDYDNDIEYQATANKNKKEITLYYLSNNYDNLKRLLAHEIGHFYYWEHNKKNLNSKLFFKDFQIHYERIKEEYNAYYFQFNPNGKYKFNKISEYFCEMFSLYLCEELSKEDIKIFEKYFKYFNN